MSASYIHSLLLNIKVLQYHNFNYKNRLLCSGCGKTLCINKKYFIITLDMSKYMYVSFYFSSIESQSKVEVMELSDLHHPNCKINRKMNSDLGVGVGPDSCRRESESSDSILLSPEASKATEAVEFIAEHLRNEDLYIQVITSYFM